jgi:hypothetical protein
VTTRAGHYDALAAALGSRAARHHPLGPMTTYGVGGPAALSVEVAGPEDLDAVRAVLVGSGLPVCVVGRGSNLLVADTGFDGIVVHLGVPRRSCSGRVVPPHFPCWPVRRPMLVGRAWRGLSGFRVQWAARCV